MPVPSAVTDLDPVASNNSPAGSEPIGQNLDEYLRAHAAIIRQVSDASNVGTQTHAATSKATPVDADELPLSDSGALFALKKLSWANLKAAIKTFIQSGITMSGALVLSADPSNPMEASTKQYVDATAGASGTAVQGAFINLKAAASGAGATVTETADEILVGNGSGQYKTLRNVSLSGSLTTSGANGLDNQAPQTVSITIATPGVVTLNGHGFPTNAAVVLATSGALPTGLTAGTTYYVVNPTTNTFQLSATQGGAAINTSGTQSGAHTVASILAANCWYSKWEIWNGTTTSLLFSSSATAPVLPSGYTHKARTGWVPTDNTANKFPLGFTQLNSDVQYKTAAGTNLTSLPAVITGVQGTPNTTLVAASVSRFVPPTAAVFRFMLYGSNAGNVQASPNPTASYTAGSPSIVLGLASTETKQQPAEFVLESTSIYYAAGVSGAGVYCRGWRDNL